MLTGGACLGTCVHACQDKSAGGRLACSFIFIVRVGWFYQSARLPRSTLSAISLGLFILHAPTTDIAFPPEQRNLAPPRVPSCTPGSSGGAELHPGT
jgi:hypothetical protein